MLPDFLCIGAQKAGTSWLHANLAQHPDLWLPPIKEVHYFNYSLRYPSPLSRKYYNDRWREQLRRRLGQRWRGRDLAGLGWDLNYFFGRRDDTWYERVFEPGRGRVCGDVTPGYSKLDAELVARIAGRLPEARVILLLRDPIDRAWSGVRMSAERRGLDLGDPARWRGYFDRQRGQRGDYLRMLRQWRAHYPPERFLVGFYEDLCERPEELLLRVFAFLGVRSEREFVPATSSQRFNASRVRPMPPEAERHLAELYVDDLRVLASELGSPVDAWLERAERVLARSANVR